MKALFLVMIIVTHKEFKSVECFRLQKGELPVQGSQNVSLV